MSKSYKRNDRWKKDRRDKNFQKSKKFKHWKDTPHHSLPDRDNPWSLNRPEDSIGDF